MEDKYSDYVYSKEDIDKAYTMGLESAVVVLEKSIGLSPEGQRYILDRLKNIIEGDKILCVLSNG
ncbi:hypothetical protein ACFL7M_13645 [Thermodesulfobacteriota bacterium]